MEPKNYRYLNKIGEGSFGTVFEAENSSSQKFAIKRLKTEKKILDQEKIENEIRIIESLKHPSILETKEIIKTPSYIFIVSEYCSGGDLESLLNSSKEIPINEVRRWVKSLIQALQYMKERRIIHRDLKPANILLTSKQLKDTEVKLCDFGFSKHLENESLTTSRLGTPLYMAPEIFSGKKYNYKVDVWSLGVITFELLFRQSLFNVRTMADLIRALNKPLKFPQQPRVPEAAIDLIRKMCQNNPKSRPSYKKLLKNEFFAEKESSDFSADLNYSLIGISEKIEKEKHFEIVANTENNERISEKHSEIIFEVSSNSNKQEVKEDLKENEENFEILSMSIKSVDQEKPVQSIDKVSSDSNNPKLIEKLTHQLSIHDSTKKMNEAQIEEEILIQNIKIREIRLNEYNHTINNLLANPTFEYVFQLYVLSTYKMILNMIEIFRSSYQDFQSETLNSLNYTFYELKNYLNIKIASEWQEDFSNEEQLIQNLLNWIRTSHFSNQERKTVLSIAYQNYPSNQEIYKLYLSSIS
jgi:serine/threonine protein kinase